VHAKYVNTYNEIDRR